MSGWTLAGLLSFSLAAVLALYVLTRRREPAETTAWILSFFLFPVAGALLYLFFGYQRYRRNRRPKPHPEAVETGAERAAAEPLPVPISLQSEMQTLATLAERTCGFPVIGSNAQEVFIRPDRSFDALERAIASARHHVHLEFYIWRNDRMGKRFGELLTAAVKRGVECRLLIDSVGSIWLRRRVVQDLERQGVKVGFFSQLKQFKRFWYLHLRNHRKLAVIDGSVGFIGSQNILDNLDGFPGPDRWWHDTQLCARGPVVNHLQSLFAEDWRFATGESIYGNLYFPAIATAGAVPMQLIPTGPDLPANVLHGIFLAMFHTAQRRVTIISPYLVPTQAIVLALQTAARRGVEVSIILPATPDNVVARLAGRSWYFELLEAGVRIYELKESAVHSKVILVDDHLTAIGSANLDVRSFQLNFEASMLVYGPEPAVALREHVAAAMMRAHRVLLDTVRRKPFLHQVTEGACRLVAPLL